MLPGTRSLQNTVALRTRNRVRYSTLLLVAAIFLGLPSPSTSAEECGRLNWKKIPYNYVPDYDDHPRSTDARVIYISRSSSGKVKVGIFTQARKKPARYAFTNDGGTNWNASVDAIPSNVGSIPTPLLQAPSDPHVIYKFDHGGIYLRSEDGGRSWIMPQYLIDGKTKEVFAQEFKGALGYQIQVTLEAIHPEEPKTLLAGFKIGRKPPSTDWGNVEYVYRSIDGGEHWTAFNQELSPFPNTIGGAAPIGIDPFHTDIYVGMGKMGLLQSSDSGKSWHAAGQNDDLGARPIYLSETHGGSWMLGAPAGIDIYQFAFDPVKTETRYIVSNKGLFKSYDGGRTWRLLDLGFSEIDSINSLAVSPQNGQELYVGSRYGIFLSANGGCIFKRVYPLEKKQRTLP